MKDELKSAAFFFLGFATSAPFKESFKFFSQFLSKTKNKLILIRMTNMIGSLATRASSILFHRIKLISRVFF